LFQENSWWGFYIHVLPINGLWFNNSKFDMKKIVGGETMQEYKGREANTNLLDFT
jgi:hypothetical protein